MLTNLFANTQGSPPKVMRTGMFILRIVCVDSHHPPKNEGTPNEIIFSAPGAVVASTPADEAVVASTPADEEEEADAWLLDDDSVYEEYVEAAMKDWQYKVETRQLENERTARHILAKRDHGVPMESQKIKHVI